MLPDDHPGRIQIAFDDHRLVNNAGLILPATLALHLGPPQLVDRHLDLGDAPGRAHPGDKVMTLVASALAGGDCIDDADVLRTGGTAGGQILHGQHRAHDPLDGGFIDPGFTGDITLELSNVARIPIALTPGMKIGQLSFLELSSPCLVPYGSPELGSRYHGQQGPTASRISPDK